MSYNQHMTEQWKDIVGFEGLYRISNKGRVWSAVSQRFMSTPPNKQGYPHFAVSKGTGQYTKRVHTEMAKAFLGDIQKGMHVRHINGDKLDNRLENLAYGTAQENADDMRGVGYRGTLRLSFIQIQEIQNKAKAGLTSGTIAREYGVSQNTIWNMLDENTKDIRKRLMLNCIQAGCGVEITGEYFGVTHSAITHLLRKHYGGVRRLRNQYPINKSLKVKDIPRILGIE